MNLTYLHLLLNHVPTIGFGFGIGWLVASLVRGSEDLRRAGYVVFLGQVQGRLSESNPKGLQALARIVV